MSETIETFTAPQEVLELIRSCLRDSDAERLYAAAAKETPELWQQRIFDDLLAIEETEGLEEVFLSATSFPGDASTFKLGGHSPRTRHLHIDLVRHGDAWRLQEIWKCR
jgi:hypothetical protein